MRKIFCHSSSVYIILLPTDSLIKFHRAFTCQKRPGSLQHEYDDAVLFASWVCSFFFFYSSLFSLHLCWNCFPLFLYYFLGGIEGLVHILILFFVIQGVDYLKYDNCFNLGIDPEERLVFCLFSYLGISGFI